MGAQTSPPDSGCAYTLARDLRALLGCMSSLADCHAGGGDGFAYICRCSMDRLEELPMSFLKNIQEIRDRARQQIENGAVTKDYKLDREQAISILNEALATELVCVLRYKFHYFMSTGIHSAPVAAEFLQHAKEEQMHADRIAK